MNNEVMFSSKSQEWETPQWLFDKYNDIYHFDLDVCASHENHKCPEYFTKEQDGLKQSWEGKTCWMNPPYGRGITKWINKAYEEVYNGYCKAVVMLLPGRVDTKYFHETCVIGEIMFLKGRLKFGGSENPAPFPSMIVLFTMHDDIPSLEMLKPRIGVPY